MTTARTTPRGTARTTARTAPRTPPAAKQRLHIDWTRCDGRGVCAELLPELLTRDEWGYPVVRDGSREPAVPTSLMEHARRAEADCPLMALKLLRN